MADWSNVKTGDIVEYEGSLWRVTVFDPGCRVSYAPPGHKPKPADIKKQIGLTRLDKADGKD